MHVGDRRAWIGNATAIDRLGLSTWTSVVHAARSISNRRLVRVCRGAGYRSELALTVFDVGRAVTNISAGVHRCDHTLGLPSPDLLGVTEAGGVDH